MTEAGIDCSGLVHMAYRRGGRLVPRDAWQQLEAGAPVGEPEPGDLVFYADPGARVDHVAFWLGDRRILHATGRDGLGVVEENEPSSLQARRTLAARL
jgi:cell wall-associated NlpC family hydrolase